MDADDVAFAGARAQAELVRRGEVSSRELVEIALGRVACWEPRLRACTSVLPDPLAVADEADRRRGRGELQPLLGVPLVVKDNVDVAGTVTSHGTAAMRTRAQFDCEAVVRLRAAGAVIIAKTTLPELAAFTHFTASKTFGTTRNPWDLTRSPGGSSGGSAVSVAAGYVGAALASDGGGSIRVPAACCGLVGLKPQRGRVPLAPHAHHWYGMGVLGPIARRVEDVALLLDVLTTSTGLVPSTQFGDAVRRDPSPLRIAFSLRPAVSTRVSSEVSRAVRETARLLESAGHRVEERDPDYGDVRSLAVPRYLRGIAADKQLLDGPDELEARTQTLVRLSRMISNSRLTRSHAKAPEYTTRINTLFDDYDVLLTPVIAKAAPSAEHWAQRGGVANLIGGVPWIAFTQVWNLTGQPALSLPAGFDSDGMPSAVQLIGPPESEALLLCLAAQLQSAAPWSDRRPPLPPVA